MAIKTKDVLKRIGDLEREIHDRIIVATAKFYKAWILTKDEIIRESGEV